MLFSDELPLKTLIELCRTLRHNLAAGLTVVDVFRQLSDRSSERLRPVARRILARLETGDGFESALKGEKSYFPPLFVSMAAVGERSGNLPEIFGEMEKYYQLQQRLWRDFLAQITMPVLQLGGAVFVIAVMLFVLGIVAEATGSKAIDPFGVGVGVSGALTWLGIVFGVLLGLFGVYLFATRVLKRQVEIHRLLLRVPVLGSCVEALALSRFCLAAKMTMDTGMSILSVMKLSFRATGNPAYVERTPAVVQALRGGDSVTEGLTAARIFPLEFVNLVAVAEEGGRLTEIMVHQARYYEEEGARRMKILTMMLGFVVWLTVAILIIIAIFRIYSVAYLGAFESLGG